MDEYSDISKQLTSDLDKSIKDGQGIFFTPPKSIRKVVNYIDHILRHKYKTVLEPSCGSCEFIKYIDKKDDLTITAIEYNEPFMTTSRTILKQCFYNQDFLELNLKKNMINPWKSTLFCLQ